MMKRNHTRLCAGAAIAAALALSSTPLLAQMSPAPATPAPEPVLTFPEAAPPAPQPVQPTLALPSELPEPAAPDSAAVPSEPVADPEPAVAAPASSAAQAERAAPRRAASVQTAVSAPADPVTAPIDDEAAPIATETPPESAAVAAPVAAPVQAPPPAANDDNTQFWAAVLAGLVAIALAVWGFIAIGRRKPVERRAAAMVERPRMAPRPPVAETPTTVTPMASARTQVAAPALSHTGAAVPLPRRMPETFAERDALLKRMIAATPDRANPFTGYKARLKRSRLILQSLGRDFGDREPWIDLSQYPSNWPELARRKHAAA